MKREKEKGKGVMILNPPNGNESDSSGEARSIQLLVSLNKSWGGGVRKKESGQRDWL